MKKIIILFIGVLFMSKLNAQDISDAVRYSLDEVQGTARFRALSGAFGALGGDLSAVSINPAGSAIFNRSYTSFTINNINIDNNAYFNTSSINGSSDSKFDLNQAGAVFVFNNTNTNSPWKKLALSIAYDKIGNFDNNWYAQGINSSSISNYFLDYAQGKRLDEISALNGEILEDAYIDIGSVYGYGHQQAFLGYETFLIEPNQSTDDNTGYFSNIAGSQFDQAYTYTSRGYNGKLSFNAGSQYRDNLYLGVNLNSHFINYERYTFLNELNNNVNSLVTDVDFENNLYTTGTGFSFQLGAILKLSSELRAGLAYQSPTWYRITEENSQSLGTFIDDGNGRESIYIEPDLVNVFPDYTLQTPGKITGSLAYVFNEDGLLSFDYSRKDYSNTKFKPTSDDYFASQNALIENRLKAANTYRIGAEYRLDRLSLRGGYRFEESPYANEDFYGNLTGYSVGLGYSFGNFKMDLTYDRFDRDEGSTLYAAGNLNSATIENQNSRLTFTVGFTL